MLLIGRTLVGIAGRHRNSDPELFGVIQEGSDILGRMAIVDRGVDVDRETFGLRSLYRRDRSVEHALLTNRFVMMLPQPVEMHREEQIW